jgi:hypothetical protein
MDEQFAHEKGRQILTEVADLFRSKPIFRRKNLHLLFVCGAASRTNGESMRAQFIHWAGPNLPQCIFLFAEEAYRNTLFHDPPETLNLAVFEAIIAEASDCVLIFPESVGSFAEMGFFSGSSTVRRKTLVANDLCYQATDSFANLGPIAAINSKSFLRPTIHLQRVDGVVDFAPLKERLERLLNRSHRIRIPYSHYKNLTYGQKLIVTGHNPCPRSGRFFSH